MSISISIDRARLELTFGVENIKQWSDLDGTNDDTIMNARISNAIEAAIANFNDAIRGYQYRSISVTASVVDLVTRMAGVKLHDSRAVIDEDPTKDNMSSVRQFIDVTLGKIRRGEIILEGERFSSTPSVVKATTTTIGVSLPDLPFYGPFPPKIPHR